MKKIEHNYLVEQYRKTGVLPINHNYLAKQFSDYEAIFEKIKEVVKVGDFTLGAAVDSFESDFAQMHEAKYAIGVGSGTDAIFLSLKALGIGPEDEVIVPTFTFYATVGAIVTAGATPVFVDSCEDFTIDAKMVESSVTSKTKVILPVHWSGLICDMEPLQRIAKAHSLYIVEDACHAIQATYHEKFSVSYSDLAAFSMHPLKNLNVWGDGGVILTNDDALHERLVLLRNHGLLDRDTCEIFAYNSRLDTVQAVVASHLLEKVSDITEARIRNAGLYDERLQGLSELQIPQRYENRKQVYHIYSILAEDRDSLCEFLVKSGIDAKVHYPTPMHLQPAAAEYGYQRGDFPVAEMLASKTISLPVHEFIEESEIDYVCRKIYEFYGK